MTKFTKNIKLLAIDLDGTLLYPKNYITLLSKKNASFCKNFIEQGGKIIFVTGRNATLKETLEKKIGKKVDYFCFNGTYLLDENNEVIEEFPIEKENALKIFDEYGDDKRFLCWVLFDNKNNMFVYTKKNKILKYVTKVATFFRFAYKDRFVFGNDKFLKALHEEPIYKLMPVFSFSDIKAKEKALALKRLFDEKYKNMGTFIQTGNSVEITCFNTDKAKAITLYMEKQGLSKEEVAVVGDSGNDLTMFKSFPISFCMKHAIPGIKAKAKFIINRVHNVADYLDETKEDILFGEKVTQESK